MGQGRDFSSRLFLLGADMMDSSKYIKFLELFVATGRVPSLDRQLLLSRPWEGVEQDPLFDFLVSLMQDRCLVPKVLSSKVRSEIFFTKTGQFVNECVHDIKFLHQRAYTDIKRSEEVQAWRADERRAMWRKLLADIDAGYAEYGFDSGFFIRLFSTDDGLEDELNWEKLSLDWREAMKTKFRLQLAAKLERQRPVLVLRIMNALKALDDKIELYGMTEKESLRLWEMTNGTWSETEFEKKLNIVRAADKYPEIEEIVERMGRTADNNGSDRLAVAEGSMMMLEHSSGSDIEGITVGNDLNSLLPSELAQYADDSMVSLFAYKYLTKNLQTFRYKSEITQPSRKLSFMRAARKGPMIVCIDTSASMYGLPQQIEQSLLGRIEIKAEELDRACFLIDFSVSVRTIDLRERRKRNREARLGKKRDDYNFAPDHVPFIGGGTSSRKLLATLFDTLDNEGDSYVNADVLIISDFLMPIDDGIIPDRIRKYRQTGTRFYALHITTDGQDDTPWTKLFDMVFTIRYRQARRY